MKKHVTQIFFFIALLITVIDGRAQTPSDAIMMKKREVCAALIYDHGSWDEYWEGSSLRSNGNVGTLTRNTATLMVAAGILDKLNLIIAAPYIKTSSSEPNGGKMQGAEGFQDLSLVLKAQFVDKKLGKGNLAFLAVAGFSTPMTNYLSDYLPYSLGFGANEWTLRGIAQYKLDNGLYARVAGAHLWRGQTKAERDYYYNNGSYYTAWMDVPDAWHYQGTLGMWLFENSFKLEASYTGSKCVNGDDIRKYNAGQPTNKVETDQLGFSAQYYFKKIKGLGILAYYATLFNGRNMGKFSNLGVGVTYQFKI